MNLDFEIFILSHRLVDLICKNTNQLRITNYESKKGGRRNFFNSAFNSTFFLLISAFKKMGGRSYFALLLFYHPTLEKGRDKPCPYNCVLFKLSTS